MREYMRHYREKPLETITPPLRDSSAIIRRVLDNESLMEQLSSMPRQASYNHLFIRLNLEPHEAEAILKELANCQ
jgi:hypothetical protein